MRYLFIGLIAVLVACAPPESGVLNSKYRGAKLHGRTLHVLPLQVQNIHNPDDFRKNLQLAGAKVPDPSAEITRLFQKSMRTCAISARLALDSDMVLQPTALQETTLYLPGEGHKWPLISLYAKPETMQQKGFSHDLALMITHFEVMRDFNTTADGFTPETHPGEDSLKSKVASGIRVGDGKTFLAMIGRYTLWDYLAEQPVAFGNIAAYSVYSDTLSRKNWEQAVDMAAVQILEQTPFKYKRPPSQRPPPPKPTQMYGAGG